MGEEAFRLPNSSYDELVKIIRAYGNAGNEATLDDIAQRAAMDRTVISRNNAFLVSVGIIGGGKAKAITERGHKLSVALQHDIADEIANCWREIVAANEFLQKMVSAVSIRQGMEDSALQSHIAYSAGEGKNPRVMAGAAAIVDILEIAGLLREDDGKLVAIPDTALGMSSPSLRETLKDSDKRVTPPPPPPIALSGAASLSGISIQIQIQCSANDVSELAPKLRSLLKELSKKEEPEAEGQD